MVGGVWGGGGEWELVVKVGVCLPVLFSFCSCLWGSMNDYLKLFVQFGYIYRFSSDVAFVFRV